MLISSTLVSNLSYLSYLFPNFAVSFETSTPNYYDVLIRSFTRLRPISVSSPAPGILASITCIKKLRLYYLVQ